MSDADLRRYRLWMGLFILGLLVSGLTAFPLLTELRLLTGWAKSSGLLAADGFLLTWLQTVLVGMEDVYARYPWMPYGTDWLAFGHIAIALFFIAAYRDPANSRGILQAGLAACLLVIPTALICGQIRGIPIWWRMIDSSFGLVGLLPLLACLKLVPPRLAVR